MNTYKQIIFDLDDTILDFHDTEEKALEKTVSSFGLPFTEQTAAAYKTINRGLWQQLEQGLISREEIFSSRFSLFLEEYGVKGSGEKAETFYREYLGEGHKMMEYAREVLVALKKQGYQLYAGTNGTAKTQWKRMAAADLLDLFDGVFISEEVGYEKPDTRFFLSIFDTLQAADKKEFLMVGDSLTSDIRGAVNAGIDSVWYNPKNMQPAASAPKSTYTITSLLELLDLLGIEKEEVKASSSMAE